MRSAILKCCVKYRKKDKVYKIAQSYIFTRYALPHIL